MSASPERKGLVSRAYDYYNSPRRASAWGQYQDTARRTSSLHGFLVRTGLAADPAVEDNIRRRGIGRIEHLARMDSNTLEELNLAREMRDMARQHALRRQQLANKTSTRVPITPEREPGMTPNGSAGDLSEPAGDLNEPHSVETPPAHDSPRATPSQQRRASNNLHSTNNQRPEVRCGLVFAGGDSPVPLTSASVIRQAPRCDAVKGADLGADNQMRYELQVTKGAQSWTVRAPS